MCIWLILDSVKELYFSDDEKKSVSLQVEVINENNNE